MKPLADLKKNEPSFSLKIKGAKLCKSGLLLGTLYKLQCLLKKETIDQGGGGVYNLCPT